MSTDPKPIGTWTLGWWQVNVPPELDCAQVVELVDTLTAGAHPSLAQLRGYAALQTRAADRGMPDPTYRCPVCRDTGMQALTGGTHNTAHAGRMLLAEATPSRPIYRPCRGTIAAGRCQWLEAERERHRVERPRNTKGGRQEETGL